VWSPHTGIVDFTLVTEQYAKDFKQLGGHIYLDFPVSAFEEIKESNASGEENKYPVQIKGPGKVRKFDIILT
jgi:L-2-hydroxyglutarate oxidase LhgO